MSNNILRTAKVKTRAQITASAENNFRLRYQHNIDKTRSHLNMVLVNDLGADLTKAQDLQEKLTEYYKKLGVKERKDNVLMMEFVVSASPDFFKGKKLGEIKEWADKQTEFFRKKFGDQLKIGVLHFDEKTPHIHFMISTELKSIKQYKNRYGVKEVENWSLNAFRYDRKFLIDLHTEHAKHNIELGLKRGVRGSMREHKSLKEFYKMVNKALNTDYSKKIEETITGLETSFLSNKVSIEEVREKFAPVINGLLKQNKALKEKYLFDFQQWAEKLKAEEERLSEKNKKIKEIEENLRARRDVYKDAINRAVNDSQLIEELMTEISDLKAEVRKLTPEKEEVFSEQKASKVKQKFTPFMKR